jgi:hypothetical protein
MSDAWGLFGSDDDEGDGGGDDNTNKRLRVDDGAAARDGVNDDGGGFGAFGAPRGGKATAATASEHAYFAASRQLWPSDAATLAGFLEAITADASRRVQGIALRLRKFKPEGASAAAALTSAEAAAAAADWPAVATAATACLAAHSTQLDFGNWPDECWQESHTLALGLHVAAELGGGEGGRGGGGGGGGGGRGGAGATADDDAHAQLADDPAAAASIERWSPATKLGRVALEALSMASLATDSGAIPSWLGAAILLAERACIAALSSERRERSVEQTNTHVGGGGGGGGGGGEGGVGDAHTSSSSPAAEDKSAWVIPDTLPHGAPEISPSRAVARVLAGTLTVVGPLYNKLNSVDP